MKFFLFFLLSLTAHSLEVASLHPLITDTLKKVGGDRVQVIEVGKPGMDVHKFQPKASDLKKIARVSLIFASGKNLEPYLGDLEDSLQSHQTIVQVGRTIPSQKISAKDEIYACCPNHAVGGIDPHWWHNVRHMERAARIIEKHLTAADPSGKAHYQERSKQTVAELRQLDRWVKAQVASIPKSQRHLVTAHAAFGYFCKAYGFKATFVQGLSGKSEIPAQQLALSIRQLQKENIRAVFPEKFSNPKILSQIAKQSGAKIGKSLIADGSVKSYQQMVQQNVTHIVNGLK